MYFIINARNGLKVKPMDSHKKAVLESDILSKQTGIAHYVRFC